MIKIFCDWCQKETKEYFGHTDNLLKIYLKKDKNILKGELTISFNGSYNSAHICKECAFELSRKGIE